MSLNTIQEELNTEPPLRIRGLLRKRTETLEQFLILFFTKWNVEKETIYVNNGHTQTEPGKRRSIGDIYRIVKYYYRKTTLKEVKDVLINLFPESGTANTVDRLRSSKCSMIHKRVYYQGNTSQGSEIANKSSNDEYGYTWEQWCEL